MAFLKFNVADNATGNLDADILASTTSITLGTGEGAVFPLTNFIATLVQYDTPTDPTTEVVKSEKILVSSRSGDILTCTRGYDGDSATTFSTGDYVYLNVVSKVIEDIQDEVAQVRTDLEGDIADLETNKLDVDSQTRTGLTNNKILKTDGSGNEGYLSFGASGTVLTGAGTTTEPTWSVPTVSITGLTAETTPTTSDLAIIYDDSSSTNKKTTLANLTKGLSPATTSAKGIVEMATDAEALAGTDEERYINPKQLKDNIPQFTAMTFGIGANIASGTAVNYPHSLGVVPKYVIIHFEGYSSGSYDGTDNKCANPGDSSNSYCCRKYVSSVLEIYGAMSFDSTNITITWTTPDKYSTTLYGIMYIYY